MERYLYKDYYRFVEGPFHVKHVRLSTVVLDFLTKVEASKN